MTVDLAAAGCDRLTGEAFHCTRPGESRRLEAPSALERLRGQGAVPYDVG